MATKPIPKRGAKNFLTRQFEKLDQLDLLSVFDPKPPKPFPRRVYVNTVLPESAHQTVPKFPLPGLSRKAETELPDGTVVQASRPRGFGGHKTVAAEGWAFSSNQVLTSKYNIITFLPRNLLEQVSSSPLPLRTRLARGGLLFGGRIADHNFARLQFRRVANVFFLGMHLPNSSRLPSSRCATVCCGTLQRGLHRRLLIGSAPPHRTAASPATHSPASSR